MAQTPVEPKITYEVDALEAVEAYKLGTGLIVPRPIGWIGTVSKDGVRNLAPYSFFNVVAMHPPTFVVAPLTVGRRDTLTNIEETGVFSVNVVTEETVEAMNATAASVEASEDEFELNSLTPVVSETSIAPMVGEAVANFECTMTQMVPVGTPTDGKPGIGMLIIGEASRIHVAERVVDDNFHIDQEELRAVGRHVGNAYVKTSTGLFDITRPA